MNPTNVTTNDRFDRLQQLLLRMNAGEQVRPADAAQQTGLTEDTCRTILRSLERAGLMALANDDHFVRRTLE
jgi:DNA-binding IclR family transcriptional regulator